MLLARPFKTLALALLTAAAWAGARAEGIAVELFEADAGGYRVEGSFATTQTASAAWKVLSDYGRIGDFVPSVVSSRVLDRPAEGPVLIEQVLSGEILWFSRRMTVRLELVEEPVSTIQFQDVGKKDFTVYKGQWSLEPEGDGLRVRYLLTAKPRFAAPGILVRKAFRRSARLLLKSVQEEIGRPPVISG